MGKPVWQPALTPQERHLIALLRQGPQSIAGLAEVLQTGAVPVEDALRSLGRTVGIVPLYRFDTLRYGLAE